MGSKVLPESSWHTTARGMLGLMMVLCAGTVGAEGFGSSAAPQAWPSSMLGPVPSRLHLPAAVAEIKGRVADAAQQRPMPRRPASDRPAMVWELGTGLTAPPLVPAGAKAYVASPDPARLAPPWRDTPADPALPSVASDPVLEPSRRTAMAGLPELRSKATPFLRLAIPDPTESATPIRVPTPPADRDPPVMTSRLPPKPMLPVSPSSKP